MAGLGQSPGRLPRGKRAAPCGQRAVAVARPGALENPGALAGCDALRRPPAVRQFRRLDFRAEEHPVAPLIPIKPPVVFGARI